MNKLQICQKCGKKAVLIRHHVKYVEIHGCEIIIMICRSCHTKLHNKLRNEGLCKISPIELAKYSKKSTDKEYHKKNYYLKRLTCKTIDKNIQLFETLQYNKKTDTITITSCFQGNNGKKILYVDIDVAL